MESVKMLLVGVAGLVAAGQGGWISDWYFLKLVQQCGPGECEEMAGECEASIAADITNNLSNKESILPGI